MTHTEDWELNLRLALLGHPRTVRVDADDLRAALDVLDDRREAVRQLTGLVGACVQRLLPPDVGRCATTPPHGGLTRRVGLR